LSFSEDMERQALPLRQAILSHPFIVGVGNGTLDVERFKYYVKQDYVYLIDYSRVLALATACAPDLKTMGWFARLLDETLNTEMDLHRSYCAEFGITAAELEATRPAPTTVAYTSFLLRVAHQGTFGELVASLLPCQWGYWEIGDHLARSGEPKEAPLYCKWIQMYTAPEYIALANSIRDLANRMAQQAGATELAAMRETYLTSFKFECLFWEMAYNLEKWPLTI
jgi:thiaminase/transcriptional activator TenA